ncbi:MAG: hypothetical protein AAF790_13200 [Planctomycetota bacterium]
MKTIELSDDRFEQIRLQAVAAGYQDVAAYLEALAADAAFDASCGMNEEQTRASAAECDAAVDRLKQHGGGTEFAAAWRTLGHEFGFKPRP